MVCESGFFRVGALDPVGQWPAQGWDSKCCCREREVPLPLRKSWHHILWKRMGWNNWKVLDYQMVRTEQTFIYNCLTLLWNWLEVRESIRRNTLISWLGDHWNEQDTFWIDWETKLILINIFNLCVSMAYSRGWLFGGQIQNLLLWPHGCVYCWFLLWLTGSTVWYLKAELPFLYFVKAVSFCKGEFYPFFKCLQFLICVRPCASTRYKKMIKYLK